jgi:hypothetical protein
MEEENRKRRRLYITVREEKKIVGISTSVDLSMLLMILRKTFRSLENSSNLKIWKIHPRSRVLYQVDDISLLDDNDELKITFVPPTRSIHPFLFQFHDGDPTSIKKETPQFHPGLDSDLGEILTTKDNSFLSDDKIPAKTPIPFKLKLIRK